TTQHLHDVVPAPAYRKITAVPPETEAKVVEWERPILRATLALPDGPLHVLNVHFKSKNPTDIKGQTIKQGPALIWKSAAAYAEGSFVSAMKRVGQAVEARALIDRIFDADANARIVACGDFNAEVDDTPLVALRGDVEDHGNPALRDRVLLPCEFSVPGSSRYTLFHHGRPNMLDHVLACRAMLAHYRGAEIHNELLHDESVAFATDQKYPESDHAPVVATFEIP
ncbi:MAG TPA: endonuclease/exonuclease/phosphatase family protein, partial [Candidatus Thermoplasmatota archaeon]|nr:endonuclease/exonuclease/phosphatase family protein [Candidatus Thermoplasmatota archaeon]